LTPAEWEVADGVRHGMTNRRIAERRGTSVDAVKTHLEHIRGKLEIEGRAGIRRWDGTPQTSAVRRLVMAGATDEQLGRIGQIALSVKDIERSVGFYRDVLGLPHLFTAGQLAFFDCGGVRLFLDALPEAQGQGNSCIYFRVENIHGVQERLTAQGVAFEGAPHMIHRHEDGTEEWMTFFRDPDGNMLSLMSAVKP
jgi:catechol 2,3-dioxygenase-like lactoylglutathione lyase family enzyme